MNRLWFHTVGWVVKTWDAFLRLFNPDAGRHEDICMIGHMGNPARARFNSEPSFLSAVENGSGGCETDVRMTADGVLVCNHNAEVKYVDGTEMIVAEHTFEELSAKPMFNPHQGQEPVYLCSFERYLEIMRDHNMICFIEFKDTFTDEMIQKAFTLAGEVYDLKMCQLQSFGFDNLVRAHEAFPDLKIMLTWCKNMGKIYERCFEYGFDIDGDYESMTRKMVRQFHKRGLKVGMWTANHPLDVYYCYSMKPDYVESDVYGKAPAIQDAAEDGGDR